LFAANLGEEAKISAKLPNARENGFRFVTDFCCKPFVFSVPFWYLGCSNTTCLACNLGAVVRTEMRKLIAILALLGLATGFTALTASADTTIAYELDGTLSAVPGFPSTSLSNAGDSFTLTFSVDSGVLGSSPIGSGMSPDVPISFTYTDITSPGFSLTDQSGIVNFFTAGDGGLFGVTFTGADGNIFMFELFGEGCSDMPIPATCVGGFTDGTPPVLATGGPFGVDPTSFFGEFAADGTPVGVDDISGTVKGTPSTTPVPEPSSLILLGSGFLALGGFARKRVVTLFS
jgi:hypothetical protein